MRKIDSLFKLTEENNLSDLLFAKKHHGQLRVTSLPKTAAHPASSPAPARPLVGTPPTEPPPVCCQGLFITEPPPVGEYGLDSCSPREVQSHLVLAVLLDGNVFLV